MISDIIWDFDGTLFDTYPSMIYAFKKALRDYCINASDENIRDYMKISLSDAINHFKEIYDLDDNLIEKFKRYEKSTPAEIVPPFPYAKEVCEEFKKKGGRNFILTHRGNSTYKYLKAYNMENCFEEIVTKHNGFKRKPDPEGYLHLVHKYNMDKANVIIVGDRDFEILAGKNAGINVCLYNTNNIYPVEKPKYEINSLKQLEDILYK